MTDDATLSTFSGADGDEDAESTVDPPRSTYAWGTYTCDGCDAATDRVWRDGDALVCPACKSW